MKKKDFNYYMHPIDLMLVNLYVVVTLFVFFHPTLLEFLVVYVVDTIALLLVLRVDAHLFSKLRPETKLYFPVIQEEQIAKLDNTEKFVLLKSFFDFPAVRAKYIYIFSFLKVIFGGIVIIFFWHDTGITKLERFIRFSIMELVGLQYYYGHAFICIHQNVSEKIREFHEKYDWTTAFKNMSFERPNHEYIFRENVAASAICVIIFVLLFTYLITTPLDSWINYVEAGFIVIMGMIFFGRLNYENRKFLLSSLHSIFYHFSDLEKERRVRLPFHTLPIVAKFEQTFNLLQEHLEAKEKELANMVFAETDKQQLQLLGEVSGIVAHDLSGPLHVISYCVDEIQNNRHYVPEKYLEYLKLNVLRIEELIDSLKAQIRNDDMDSESSSLSEAYRYCLTVIKTQFRDHELDSISFEFDERLCIVRLGISRIHLGHILYNFLKNAIEAICKSRSHESGHTISLRYIEEEGNSIVWSIENSGSKFLKEHFESVIGSDDLGNFPAHKGLGLRLTLKIIERNGGNVHLITDKIEGTCFYITMKRVS